MRSTRPFAVLFIVALGSFAVLAVGCRGGAPGGGSPGAGSTPDPGEERVSGRVYSYVAFGAADTVTRVVGTLAFRDLVTRFPCRINGTWNLRAVGDPGNVGPQVGAGTLEGEVDQAGKVHINLNPGMADNNVFLIGSFVGGPRGSIEGEWRVSTFVGEVATGRFRAIPGVSP